MVHIPSPQSDGHLQPSAGGGQRQTVYEAGTDDLPLHAVRLGEAPGDGTLDLADAIDLSEPGSVLHFYENV